MRDEDYAREKSERLNAAIRRLPLAKKVGYSALACIPIACAAYGVDGLLHSCPGDKAIARPVGFMMSGGIFSLFSLAWFVQLALATWGVTYESLQRNRTTLLLVVAVVPIGLRIVLHPVGTAINRAEAARCHLPPHDRAPDAPR